MTPSLQSLAEREFIHLTTAGRRSGRSRRVELWFAASGDTIYMLAGGGAAAGWVRNILTDPRVKFQIGDAKFRGRGRAVEDAAEERLARDAVFAKYQPEYGGDLTGWRESALPIAVDVEAE